MKSAPATAGRRRIEFTVPDAVALRGQPFDVVFTVGGAQVLRHAGTFPNAGGLVLSCSHVVTGDATVVADAKVAGATIAANRDGTLAVSSE